MINAAIQKRLTKLEAEVERLKSTQSAVERARTRLRAEILKGIASGPGKPIDAGYWKRLRALARQHARKA